MLLLARIVRLATALVVALIVAGIVLHLVGANASNGIVSAVYDGSRQLVSPFANIFKLHGKASIAVNWGVAALVYAIVGGLIARLLAGAGLAARERFAARRRPAAL